MTNFTTFETVTIAVLAFFAVIYILSVIELLGSYWICRYMGYKHNVQSTLLEVIFVPFITPLFAYVEIIEANEAYGKVMANGSYVPNESMFSMIIHGFTSFRKYNEKHLKMRVVNK